MHPVEEDSRFAIQPVYPDRQALCAEGEEHGKKQPSRLRAGREVASGRAVSGRRRLFLESWDQTRQKNERGVVLDHPNSPRVFTGNTLSPSGGPTFIIVDAGFSPHLLSLFK
jgi:hypothetical protein